MADNGFHEQSWHSELSGRKRALFAVAGWVNAPYKTQEITCNRSDVPFCGCTQETHRLQGDSSQRSQPVNHNVWEEGRIEREGERETKVERTRSKPIGWMTVKQTFDREEKAIVETIGMCETQKRNPFTKFSTFPTESFLTVSQHHFLRPMTSPACSLVMTQSALCPRGTFQSCVFRTMHLKRMACETHVQESVLVAQIHVS